MRIRSLPHFKHAHIGKTSHTKKFSYFHVNYIVREDACTKVLAGNMPANREDARMFFEALAYKDGVAANARVADTFIIALPIELTAEQRYDLIERYMHKIGKGRIAWIAGFHDKGEDAHNPHCHVILRDADIETGRKVIGTTTNAKDVKEAKAKGWQVPPRMTTKDLRVAWCKHVNDEMRRLGIDVRFDERRLKERGVDREPEIHVGRKGHAMADAGKEAVSEDRQHGDHVNPYTLVDAGNRHDHNERIKARNHMAHRSGGPVTYAASFEEARQKQALRERQATDRKAIYGEQALDRAALRKAHKAERREHERMGRALYANARAGAYATTGESFKERWKAVERIKPRRLQREVIKDIRQAQKNAYTVAAAAEVENMRPEKNARWQTLRAAQAVERQALAELHTREQRALSRQHIAERHALQERWSQTHLKAEADRLSGSFETRQSMAVVQTNALKLIKLRAKQDRGAWTGADEAIAFFSETARAEVDKRQGLRQSLTAEREANLARPAQSAARSRAEPGVNVQKRHGSSGGKSSDAKRAANDPGSDNRKDQHAGKASKRATKSRAANDRYQDLFAQYRTDNKDRGRDGGRSGR